MKEFIVQNALSYHGCDENDYMMYVDADTIIRKCDNFDNFENQLLTNKMIFTTSPWYKYDYKHENVLNKYRFPELYIVDIKSDEYLQTSFFAGQIASYNQFTNDCFELTQLFTKSWKFKRIPPMIDQAIITKIVHDNKDKYIVDNFITNYYSDVTVNNVKNNTYPIYEKYCSDTFILSEHPNVFLFQKFNSHIKESIRYSI